MFATIDIGTNTVRLLVGSVRDGEVAPAHYGRHITRLGSGLNASKELDPAAVERTVAAIAELVDTAHRYDCVVRRAVATEAVRKAVNADAFLAAVSSNCNLEIDVINGTEEARLSAAGALSALKPRPESALIVDIGGGSTELIFYNKEKIEKSASYPVGSVGLHEEISAAAQQRRLDDFAAKAADFLNPEDIERLTLVGTAGTVTTIAAALQELEPYDWRRINNYRFDRVDLDELYAQLQPLSAAEREQLPGIERGRGDILPAGITILQVIMRVFRCDQVTVSDFGLLEGTLLDLVDAPRQ